jgi:type IV fimbrial biogenesis protein FimT
MNIENVRSPRAQCGFTLVEAMITITVMLVLMSVAVPSFRDASHRGQLRTAANDLVTSVHFARSEAIKRNAPVTMCTSSDGVNCSAQGGWQQGWIVRSDVTLRQQSASPRDVRINAGGINNLTFQPTGVDATSAVFTVCRTPAGSSDEQRRVTIDATGRPSVRKTTGSACS